jgi:uncharacterized protein (TIGR02145 family)
MKKLTLSIIAMIFATIALAQTKIAVFDFKAGAGVTQNDVEGISAMLVSAMSQNSGYTIVERMQIDKVISEQGFQKTSLTQQEMVRIGQILNVHKIVLGDISFIFGQYNIDSRIIDVQTGEVDASSGATWTNSGNIRDSITKVAQDLIAQIKLKVKPAASVSFTTTTTQTVSEPSTPQIVTLFGYLSVYPEDLGSFSVYPEILIDNVNKNASYGKQYWRLPTEEELQVIKANQNKIIGIVSNGRYLTSDVKSITDTYRIRLVTTGVPQEKPQEISKDVVIINGVKWANRNVGGHGTFVPNPEDKGRQYTYDEAQNVCPSGFRIPTREEIEKLINAGSSWTYKNGVNGRVFGSGNNTIFFPAAGYRGIRDGILYDGRGEYWGTGSSSGRINYRLYFDSDRANSNYSDLNYELSVRCVAE